MPKQSASSAHNNSDSESETKSPQQPSILTYDDYSNFDLKRLTFVPLKPLANSKQNCGLPRYLFGDLEITKDNLEKKATKFFVATPVFTMSKGGIFPYDKTLHGDEKNCKSRIKFKLTKDNKNKEVSEFFNLCNEIDKFMKKEINDLKNKNNVLTTLNEKKEKKQCTKLTYKPIVKTREVDEEKKIFEAYDFINVEFSKTKEYSNVKETEYVELDTQVFVENNEEPEKTKTVSDMEKYLKWNCDAQFIIEFYKIWMQNSGERQCSISIKCVQMCITKQAESSSSQPTSQLFSKNLFSTKKETKKVVEEVQKEQEEEEQEEQEEEQEEKQEEQEESDNDDSEPEKEPTPEPSPVKSKKPVKNARKN